jgi:hypothetical protein
MITDTIRLVQIIHANQGRKLAVVKESELILLEETDSVYDLALRAIHNHQALAQLISSLLSNESISYEEVYQGRSAWKLLPSFDHPSNPYACLVSGTGLTHKSSAMNRQAMHTAKTETITDSMQMYQWGVEEGHPSQGQTGVQPEWFYKGNGSILRAHGDELEVPSYGNDGGEEAEIAGVYVIDKSGQPVRIGFTTGNEFSDHIMEKKNYLYLAPSKLRSCAIGPELVLNASFNDISGEVFIHRDGDTIWSSEIKTGENNMAHSLTNIEHHHFKYAAHRQPFQAHVHFFGADSFSFGNKITLQNNDEMQIRWNGFGMPLINRLRRNGDEDRLVTVRSIIVNNGSNPG